MAKSKTQLIERLSKKSQEELLTLLEQLLQQQPDLESLIELLLELPLVSTAQEKSKPSKGRIATLDPATIRKQVDMAIYNAEKGWGAASRIASDLEDLCDIGDSFAEAGEWANAQVVYETIVKETVEQYEELEDEDQINWVLRECTTGLIACLSAQSVLPPDEQLDAEAREALLATLLDLWEFGHNYGGIAVDIPAVIIENSTEQERQWVEAELRKEMRSGQDHSSQWHNRYIVDFLATLKKAEHYSDEDILEEYRKAGLYKELTEKLLQLNRENEALHVAQASLTEPRDVTWFAEQLLTAGDTWREQALSFVETRLNEVESAPQNKAHDFTRAHTVDTYRHWLSEKYLLYGKAKQAVDIELARFQANPHESTYRSVRVAAQTDGQEEHVWSNLHPRLLQILEQQGRWAALVGIYLDEGDVGRALSALTEIERTKTSLYGYGYNADSALNTYQTQVAKAAEEQYPDEAIRLYKSVAQKLISGRGRENYQQATGYLSRVKLLYQKQGREAEWHAYITNLRNSNKSLRALKEELDKRDL